MSKWISDAYIKRLLQNNRLLQGNCEYKLWEQEVEKAVDVMPSIDIEPKRGEWEEKETFHNGDDEPIIEEWQSAMCSVCHKYHTTPYMYYFNNYNFCPNCGADMRERESE